MQSKKLTPQEHDRCRKALFDFLATGYEDHGKNMWSTIVWANAKLTYQGAWHTDDESHYLRMSGKELSASEKNQVIHELTMGGVVNGTQH